ncbi:MAG: hypothetical protein B7Z61_08420 [Acidobacteria bacterium 37-71-11]|nr:MAG: hypothetical protein B7Z61_08420 [Acidobacteria bacterium 37-71-11]
MRDELSWIEELPASVTLTDASGTIIAMNARSRATFAAEGGAALLGASVFPCHPEPALAAIRTLYETQAPNHYTISKGGQKRIIHQLPWYRDGHFAGLVEISIPIPDTLPHFDRD